MFGLAKLALLSIFIWSVEFKICDDYQQSKEFLNVRKAVDSKIAKFSKSEIVVKNADLVLSKLITAKSPGITEWLRKHGEVNKSEDQIVLDWRNYYGKNLLLSKYPQGDVVLDREIESLVDSILKENLTQKFQRRMNKLFNKSKGASIEYIKSHKKIDNHSKRLIIERLTEISLYWPRTLKTSRNNNNPQDLINWGIAYDPKHNSINMGLNSLGYPNDEAYVGVFTHELGHSIDSCRWGAFFKGQWPFKKVGDCLRSTKSVGAKKRDDSQLIEMRKAGRISADDVAGLQLQPTCNRLVYPPPGVQADQLPESFADWFSAEVVAEMSSLDFSKIRIDLCLEKKLVTGSSYPKNEDRLMKIYFAHPRLNKKVLSPKLGTIQYCKL